jgi:hypothetical protein
MMGTISASQIYGTNSGDFDLDDSPGDSDEASGPVKVGEKSPAIFWLVLVVMLVSIRFLYEFAK